MTSNSNGSITLALMATSREAVKTIGTSNAAAATAFGTLTASLAYLYQNDDETRTAINQYLSTRGKDADKKDREHDKAKLEADFAIVKPGKGAKPKDRFMYNNRISRIETAFKRAVAYAERGLRFVYDDKRFFLTADSYKKISPDHTGTLPVEVTTMQEKDSVTWSGLMPKKDRDVTTVTVGKDGIAGSAGNFAILCNATKQSAESVEPQKMTGSDRLAALNAFFALQALLGAKEDKAMVAEYTKLTNDPARKAA